jgi:chromosome segregation protein
LDTVIQELQLSMNEVKLKLNSMKERLSVEFEIDLDALMEENPEVDAEFMELGESSLREIVQKAKEKAGENRPHQSHGHGGIR